jgi:hypothetical protein
MRFQLLKLEKRAGIWVTVCTRKRGGWVAQASQVEITLWKRIQYLERKASDRP